MLLELGFLIQLDTAQKYSFGLLKDKRNDYSFVPYTSQQKTQVAQTMPNLLNIYVHRENKIKWKGN
jgi:hypothetical protein